MIAETTAVNQYHESTFEFFYESETAGQNEPYFDIRKFKIYKMRKIGSSYCMVSSAINNRFDEW